MHVLMSDGLTALYSAIRYIGETGGKPDMGYTGQVK